MRVPDHKVDQSIIFRNLVFGGLIVCGLHMLCASVSFKSNKINYLKYEKIL